MGELLAFTCDSCGEPMVPEREHAGRRRLRLVGHDVDAEEARAREADAPARAPERAPANLARLRTLLLELGRPAEGAGALCATVGRTVADARSALAGIEPELPGLFTANEV